MRILERGDHGIGIRIKEGDRFTIPAAWLTISAYPLKSRGHLTEAGLKWFAKLIFLGDLPRKADQISDTLDKNDSICTDRLKSSELIHGLDIENTDDFEKIFEILKDNQDSAEWFALMFGLFSGAAQDAIREGDAMRAAWAATSAERYRSMLVFKENLEEVVWMGHSAKRLVNILEVWDNNRTNSDEEFWQIQFNENSYVLSQVFSVPVMLIQDKAYVGGMSIDRQDARFVDFLYSGDTSNEAILIEIKTPTTQLLGRKYRKAIHRPSSEISGASVQITDYKLSLIRHLEGITKNVDKKIAAFNPRCLIIAGNSQRELDTPEKRHSFEVFRSTLNNVELITYDELFKKIEILASLFNLVRKKI